MKIALVTDLHFGARSDSPVFDAFFEKFYKECFFPYLKEHDIKTVIDLGDTFDKRKSISFQTLKNCKRYFFDKLRDNGIIVHAIVGNHDTAMKNTNDINSVDLVLREYDNIVVYESPKSVSFDGTEILMLPWICSGNYDESMEVLRTTAAEIVMGHLEIAGFQMYRGSVNEHGLSKEVFERFDLVASGHFHHRSSNGNIHYLGNPYEITWQDCDDPRGFHVFDTDTRELTFVKNPFTIYQKIHYDDIKDTLPSLDNVEGKYIKVIVANKTDFKKFEIFINELNKAGPVDVKIVEDYSEFETNLLDEENVNIEDTVQLLSSYVDALDTDSDKDRIKRTLKELYVEAINSEVA